MDDAITTQSTGNGLIPPDEHLISLHKEAIEKVEKEISETILNPKYKATSRHWAGIIEAKYAQLEELDSQLRNYEAVVSRAQDNDLRMRESYRFAGRLPAFAKRCEIHECVNTFGSENRFLIVQGQTGSGKSTQLPQYISDHPRMAGKKVICTQPRKIAALSLAERVSFEYSCGNKSSKIGSLVGYSIGGQKPKSSKEKTRIEFMTEGRMLERLMNRREDDFANIGAIIIDEAHERSIICDILLGTLKKNDPLWSDILVVVASATIDLKSFAAFFNDTAKIVEIAGRMYPVKRIYRPIPEDQLGKNDDLRENGDIIMAVAKTALEIHNTAGTDSGDVLCFLPGAEEVHRGALLLEKMLKSKAGSSKLLTTKIYELSGRQEPEEQKEVFEELDPTAFRKIIFASPIAETSITINGVVYVVDSGYKKEMTFDCKRNISALQTVTISQSSSLQREGRAGRTQPGVCYKLYSEEDFQNMSINHLPEIFRRPLPLAIIYLRKMGIDPVAFDWISAPEPETIKAAEEELVFLGAIDGTNKAPTILGNLISFSQQEPKTVRMIYTRMLKGSGVVAVKIAALLSVSKLFFLTGGKDADQETRTKLLDKRKELQHEDGDVLTMLKLYLEYEALDEDENEAKPGQKLKDIRMNWLQNNALSKRAINLARSTVRDLEFIFSKTELWKSVDSQELVPDDENVLRLFCSGYFLHAARRVNVKGNGPGRLSYFALEPEVVGNLPSKSSLVQTSKDENGDVKNEKVPDWILFDQILKYPDSTVFPLSSRIRFGWIQDESDDFYKKCIVKENKLPTEVVEIKESETVIRNLLGRRLMFLPRFEDELNCSLVADLYMGSLRAFCSVLSVKYVRIYLETQVERIKVIINNERFEQTWRANTRLVIGPGYEVHSILFSGEFDVIHIRNLNKTCTYEQLEQLVHSKIDGKKVLSIRLVLQETACMGVVRLTKPSEAARLLNDLKSEPIDIGEKVVVLSSLGDVSTGTIPKGEEVKVKISWPLGYSTGQATFILETAKDGNKVVDLIRNFFPGAIANAFGERTYNNGWIQVRRKNRPSNSGRDPKVYIETGLLGYGRKYKFVEGETYEFDPEFKVRAKFLQAEVDEFQIINFLKSHSITPLRVFVDREAELPESEEFLLTDEEREEKLTYFLEIFETHKNITLINKLEKAGRRGVVYAYHPDTATVEKEYSQLQKKYLDLTVFHQPHRVELERTFTFSVHIDLYQCLKFDFKAALREIRKRNIWAIESGPGTGNKKDGEIRWRSKFVIIKFRHSDPDVIRHCRRLLEEVVQRDVFDGQSSVNIANLFTYTGRLMINEQIPSPSVDYYIHWDNRNQQAYIYGKNSEIKHEIKLKLQEIIDRIETWKQADLFEIVIKLDRKNLENTLKKKKTFVDSLCEKFNFVKGQYRLVGRNKLIISTSSQDRFDKFKELLDGNGLLMSQQRKNASLIRDCEVCFCEVDSRFMVTSLCNHAFCMACIQNMFTSVAEGAGVQAIPLRCPADKCERLLPLQDIMKIVPPQVITKLNETALDMFLRTEDAAAFKYCPKPGCNQVFIPKIISEESKFYTCDHCLCNFCLECTEFLGKEISSHPGVRCEDMRASEDDRVRKLMNQIRNEILCLRCPRCKTSFFDYSGCAALTCSTCKAAFCALCLRDCGSDAHSHVSKCKFNTTGGYYVELSVVNNANRAYRIQKLSEFFRDSLMLQQWGDSDFVGKLLGALSRDLNDLKIDISDIKDIPLIKNVNFSEEEKLEQLISQVRNYIITLCCPSCRFAFNESDGEAVVTCSACLAEFCSLCHEDYGEDSRSHLVNCLYNETGDLYVDKSIVKNANRLLRISKLMELIQNSPDCQSIPDMKSKLLNAVAEDLSGLNINVTDF